MPVELGTKGGLRVNSDAQVVDESNRPVTRLYAIGNTTCSLFGHTYPGAGATLGPAITFGFTRGQLHCPARVTWGRKKQSSGDKLSVMRAGDHTVGRGKVVCGSAVPRYKYRDARPGISVPNFMRVGS